MSLLPSTSLADMTAGDYFVHSLPGAPDGAAAEDARWVSFKDDALCCPEFS